MPPERAVQDIFGEHPYATLVAEIRDFVIFLMDREGRIVSWNEGARLIFGYDKEEIVGQAVERLFVPEDLQNGVPEQELRTAQREGRAEDTRWHLRKDGSRFWANGVTTAVTTAVTGEAGELLGYAKVARDDTPRRQDEIERENLLQQLEFERARLAAIFGKSPAFVAVLRGPQHVFELVNPAYYQLIGHRDIIGKTVLEALPEIEGQGFMEILDGVVSSGFPFEGREIPVRLQREPSGPIEERFVDLLYQPLLEADGTVSGVFAHGVDITEQVQARRSAEEANRVKDEFLATLSHELRTPLTAIMGWTSILQSGAATPEETARALSTIERNARAQAQLIEDILDVSRVITGKLRLEVQPVDVAHMIENAVSSVLPAARAKGIKLQRILDSGASLVSGDPARLQQIVWNLLSNAIKFTPRDGQVQIRLERVDSHLEITVADSGAGIAAEVLPHVFERFRQADSTSTRKHGGLGLGLAIVRHLVEMHGGSVEAHSEGLGKGAVFTVKLPLAGVAPAPRQASGERRAHPGADLLAVPGGGAPTGWTARSGR